MKDVEIEARGPPVFGGLLIRGIAAVHNGAFASGWGAGGGSMWERAFPCGCVGIVSHSMGDKV
jgi:hypothetical protein